jgi:hypothetical protein
LLPPGDDGIVVAEVKKGDVCMLASEVPARLRERLGNDATNGLLEALERTRDQSMTAAMTACGDRFERRLIETSSALRLELAGVRQEMHDGFATLRQEVAVRHADQLKWSFLFWVGQVAVVAGLFGVLLRATT